MLFKMKIHKMAMELGAGEVEVGVECWNGGVLPAK